MSQKRLPPNIEQEMEEMRTFLSKMVRGQPKAIQTICNQFEYSKTLRHIEERKGPIGVVMFLGPSGVGKTELARALAKYLRGFIDALTKIECVTLSQPHTIQTLLGAPPGYVGWENKPLLSQEVLDKTNLKSVTADSGLERLLSQKSKLINSIKTTRGLIYEMGNQLSYRLDQLQLISEHVRNVGNITDSLRKSGVNLESVDKNSITNHEEILKTLHLAQTEFNLFLKEREEIQAKLAISSQVLRKINQAINEIKSRENTQSAAGRVDSPVSVILFDEIERADRAIHNLLLQIMEDARVTLADGTVSNLENSFIILTSNIGSREIGNILKEKGIGFSSPSRSKKPSDTLNYSEKNMEEFEARILATAERELEKAFAPEFRGET